MKDFLKCYVDVVWRLLPGALLVLAVLWLCGCTTREAQVATQTALDELAVGVKVAGEALADETPRLSKLAAAEVWRQCPAPCATFEADYNAAFSKVTAAIKGMKIARDSLHVAQGAQDVWVATGELPDTGPLCDGIGEAVGPLPTLLTDAGVENIPEQVSKLAGPLATVACDVVSDWVKNRR